MEIGQAEIHHCDRDVGAVAHGERTCLRQRRRAPFDPLLDRQLLLGAEMPTSETCVDGHGRGLAEAGAHRRSILDTEDSTECKQRLAQHRRLVGGAGSIDRASSEPLGIVELRAIRRDLAGQGVHPDEEGRVGVGACGVPGGDDRIGCGVEVAR